ncbi:hypothetical protein BDZ89DRAFT_1070639 [Hymenopellis radicata]|nr:hypothetical protein BDZ89DRAFT_1070639 [Hymenopellis radicata]
MPPVPNSQCPQNPRHFPSQEGSVSKPPVPVPCFTRMKPPVPTRERSVNEE